ncbi:DUF6089 family protein [Flavihumibacter petaseus]|uniref:DUF6089 domain-containing protein n=1 Tax=Flavihumibacter petaseus NBRC 106054 TaxID=1220578 RepID=A0A0E9N6S6_9BACT|nr:DUF6089 family protein [Flavihumibacter petaseus]GAO45652.1 hypothetical protein FPE01S_07_00400 [Flavihumibacter petaseus NBRC 106054]
MKRIVFFLLTALPLPLLAQQWHITAFGGVSNYQGDMQEKRFTTNQSHGAFGLGLQYDFSSKFSVRGGLYYARISGDDKVAKDSQLIARNLNFSSQLLEGTLLAEYRFLDLDTKKFTPYIFAGVGAFGFDPYTNDTSGQRHYLQPLTTEGKTYSRVQLSFPFGAGIKIKVTSLLSLGYEVGIRATTTDYLDDLSDRYVDHDQLLAAKGAKAVELAYRGGELKDGNPNYPVAGTVRGRPDAKDWYYFQGITLIYQLGGVFEKSGSGKKSSRQLDCPKDVY